MQITVKKAQIEFSVEFDELPANSQAYVIEYGLRQILNDSVSAAKTQIEAEGLCRKKFDALVSGELRVQRESTGGDPIAKRAREIALAKVQAAPKFKAWAQANGFRPADKAYRDQLLDLAKPLAARADILAQAKADVEALYALDIDIDF